jgi:hypothetical protein
MRVARSGFKEQKPDPADNDAHEHEGKSRLHKTDEGDCLPL